MTVRVPMDMYARLARAAKLNRRSVAGETVRYIEKCIREEKQTETV